MYIPELLSNSKTKVTVSFEIIPSQRGLTKQALIESLQPLMEVNPLFVDVTCHRNKVEYQQSPDGKLIFEHHRYISTLAICEAIAEHFNVEVMPHIMCGNFTKQDTEEFLIDAAFYGFDNLFAVRGDKLLYEQYFTPNKLGNTYAFQLIDQINQYNKGKVVDSTIKHRGTHKFCVGAACYPEKHIEAPNLGEDTHSFFLKKKYGAKFFITQMFFDNSKFYEFTERISSNETVIIPGLKVLTSESQYYRLPGMFGISIPNIKKGLKELTWEGIGVNHCINQCKDLIAHGFTHLHFFTMNSTSVLKVLREIL